MPKRLPALAALIALSLTLAGCGGGGNSAQSSSSTTRPRVNPVQEEIYDRSYTECSSVSLKQLATKYGVSPTRAAIVRAVALAWSHRFGAGARGVAIGESGCRDGLESRAGPT